MPVPNNAKLLGIFQACLLFSVPYSVRINFKYQFKSKFKFQNDFMWCYYVYSHGTYAVYT